MPPRSRLVPRAPCIRLTPEVLRLYEETIALHPPETFALLGGRLEDPFLVTDFRFCPPRRTGNGRLDASTTHINIDAELLNFIVDHEWKPSGKYMLGIWHSHPGLTRPSVGDRATNTGDIAFFSACLEHDDSLHRAWRFFLAPITTFDADGSDRIHGWVLARGAHQAHAAHVILDPTPQQPLPPRLLYATLSESVQHDEPHH